MQGTTLHYKDTHAGKVLAYPQDMAFQFGLLAVLVAAVAVCAGSPAEKSRRLLVLDRFLGEMSFPLYLYHYPVGIVFASLFAGAHSGLTALSAGAVSCIAAVAMYYPVEPLLRRARNRVRGRALGLDVSAVAASEGQTQQAAA